MPWLAVLTGCGRMSTHYGRCSLKETAGSLCSRCAAVMCIERDSHQQPWLGLQADVCLDQCAPGDSSGACLFPNTSSNVGTPPPLPILLLLLLAALGL